MGSFVARAGVPDTTQSGTLDVRHQDVHELCDDVAVCASQRRDVQDALPDLVDEILPEPAALEQPLLDLDGKLTDE